MPVLHESQPFCRKAFREKSRGMSHRRALADASRELIRLGLNQGTAGNISVRNGEEMLITPSGIPPAQTTPEMMAATMLGSDEDLPPWRGPNQPSSEWRLHRDILRRRTDVGAVVHTHSLYATVLAIQHRDITAVHYMIAAFGGPRIHCTPYAPFGTQELSDLILTHLGLRHAVLLGNHGMVVTGRDLEQALWRATELEALAKLTVIADATGTPVLLSDDEIARTGERFTDYGLASNTRA